MSLTETENYFRVYNSIRHLPPFLQNFFACLVKNELKNSLQGEISMLMCQANERGNIKFYLNVVDSFIFII